MGKMMIDQVSSWHRRRVNDNVYAMDNHAIIAFIHPLVISEWQDKRLGLSINIKLLRLWFWKFCNPFKSNQRNSMIRDLELLITCWRNYTTSHTLKDKKPFNGVIKLNVEIETGKVTVTVVVGEYNSIWAYNRYLSSPCKKRHNNAVGSAVGSVL